MLGARWSGFRPTALVLATLCVCLPLPTPATGTPRATPAAAAHARETPPPATQSTTTTAATATATIAATAAATGTAAAAATSDATVNVITTDQAQAPVPPASPASAPAPALLAAGEERRLRIEPDAGVRFRLEPCASFVEVTVAFEGAELLATLRDGDIVLNAARAPERTRGDLTLSAVLAATADGADGAPAIARARPCAAPAGGHAQAGGVVRPIDLSLAVSRDYAHAAEVVVRWTARGAAPRDRDLAARQLEICTSVDDWRTGRVDRLRRAAGTLAAATDRLRALDAPALLFEALVTRGYIHADLNERDPAIAALTDAASLARTRGDANGEAMALLKLSAVHGSTGQPDLARQALNEALVLRRRAGDERGELEVLANLAMLQTNTGAQAEGLAALTALQPMAARVGDLRLSSAIDNVRGVALAQTGRPREALDAYGRALELRQRIGDLLGEGQTLSNMGTTWRDLGEARRGITMMEQALAIRREAGHRQGVANTLYNLGNAHLDLSEYQRAIDYLTESLVIWRETQGLRGEAFTLQNLGVAAYGLSDQEKAQAYFEQALPLWGKVGDRRGEGIVLNHLTWTAINRGAFDQAAAYNGRALAATRAAHARREEADALSTAGQLLRRRGDPAAAVDRLRESIALSEEIGNRNGTAMARLELGRALEALGRVPDALTECQTALRLREETGNRRGQAAALTAIAQLQRKTGALADGQASIERALDIIESLRTGVASSRARTTLGVSTQSAYETARDILIDRHLADPAAGHDRAALVVQERARARSLLEALNEGHPPLPAGDAAARALVDREIELEADIESKTARLGRMSDAGQPVDRLTEARAELSALVVALDDVKADIRKRSPSYAALTQPKTLSADALQQLLDADTVLIEIALGETRSVGWLVSPSAIRTVILPPRAAIESAAREVMTAVTARNVLSAGETAAARRTRIARADTHARSAAAALSAQVFTPFGPIGARRLALVTDGLLAGVPFAMLPMTPVSAAPPRPRTAGAPRPEAAGSAAACAPAAACATDARKEDARKEDGQVDDGRAKDDGAGDDRVEDGQMEVVTLPSASVLAELRRGRAARPPRTVRVAVLADPVFRADDPRVSRTSEAPAASAASASVASTAVRAPEAVGTSSAPAAPGAAVPAAPEAAVVPANRSAARDAAIESLETLPRLPFSREEAQAIEAMTPPAAGRAGTPGPADAIVALDFAASRDALTQPAFAAPGVLHIATHAIVDEVQPELSGIVLSLVDARGARVRGFLPLVEVYDLPVAADLVVLSACRTAAGPDLPGEGLASLTRGFMYAGSPRLIATLWTVEDRATAVFMRAFYQALFTRGLAAPAALRAAQAALRQSPRWAAPYYWAAFTFQGDWQ